MDSFSIIVRKNDEILRFEIVDYVHHNSSRCQFEVYLNGILVASFQPDLQDHLYICKKQGHIDEDLLNLLADEIESYEW